MTVSSGNIPGSAAMAGSDDQEHLSGLLQKRLTSSKRAAIAKRARQAGKNERKGRCRTGSAKDLLADLNG